MLLLYLVGCFTLTLGDSPITLTNQWPGGFQGTFTVHAGHDWEAWEVTLKFDNPVDTIEIWKANLMNSTGGTEFIVENMAWNGAVDAGDNYIVEFIGRYTGAMPTGTYDVAGTNRTGGSDNSNAGGSILDLLLPMPAVALGSEMKYNYGDAIGLSMLFYDAQRSGKLPGDNRIPWRGDSGLNDGNDVGRDLTGGWYDAGQLKFTLPMAYSTWMLEWGLLKFKDAYAAAGQTAAMCDTIKWPLDYFLKCWVPDQETLYVLVGDDEDNTYWGRPEDMNTTRPSFAINSTCRGSDVAADTAAAMAAGYLVFKDICGQNQYASQLLTAAKSLYAFAVNNRGLYSQCVTEAAAFYPSTTERDDLALAGAWLHMATGEDSYLTDAKNFREAGTRFALSWDDTMVAANLLLYEITRDAQYKQSVNEYVTSYMPGANVITTQCGLAYREQYGSNRYAANAAFIATIAAADGMDPIKYKDFAIAQINYILGDNKYHISYEVGFGSSYPLNPHHRGSACPTDQNTCSIDNPGPNPNLLKGALVGGPDQMDIYEDMRNDTVKNDVATNYNAGFQGALAGLLHFAQNSALPYSLPSKC